MKISVYAIAKNEEAFAERWYNSMREADEICVLDTGSTDGTVEKFRSLGVKVEQRTFEPFDFGAARNAAMAMVSHDTDILVCTDIDEYFTKGWADAIRRAFKAAPEATCAACRFITRFNEDGTPCDSMHYWKIHRPCAGAEWKARVHEYLSFKNHVEVYIPDMTLEHHPDPKKSREQYLDLLRIEALEVGDPRSIHYYGRELMFHKKYLPAIAQFERYLKHPDAKWVDERAYTMRFMARCYGWLGEYEKSVAWFLKSMCEQENMREPCVDLAEIALSKRDWNLVEFGARSALSRTERNVHYFTEDGCWREKPHDLLSVALYHKGKRDEAIAEALTALRYAPHNERIRGNFNNMMKEKEEVDGRKDKAAKESGGQDSEAASKA